MLHLSNMGFFVGWIAGSLFFGLLAEEFGESRPPTVSTSAFSS
jgi:hypothetical protein